MRLNQRLERLRVRTNEEIVNGYGALTAQRATDAKPSLSKNADTTFGVYK